jgi:type IV pilus assembly protein PilY1
MTHNFSRSISMKSRLVAGALLAGSLVIGHGKALAEDIDLFVQPAGAATGIPNVLLVLDNTANWGRTVDGQAIWINELDALITTLTNIPVNDDGTAVIRVGVMMFNETGNPNNNVGGGYVRAAIRNMTDANKTKYMNLLSSFNVTTDRSNNGKAGLAMAEAWRYYDGQAPYAGNSKVKTDYTGNTTASNSAATRAVHALPGNAIDSFAGSPYNSPVTLGDCGRNYIIYLSNGAAQDNSSDIATGTTMLNTAAADEDISGAAVTIPISPSGSQANMADEWARFMRRSSLGIITYTVDVDKISTGQGPGWSALLKSIAGVSNGRYFDVTSGNGGAELTDALGRIFSEIQAVNSVFASVSLPVNITTQGTFLNQIYIGQFRPDADALPRWPGNMKQYKLGIVDNQLRTLDADDFSAINPGTGFLTECARSFWTPSAVDTYWQFYPQGGCLAVPNSNASNYPDGNIVEKGGHAYRLRSTTTRTMKTCSPAFASCTTLTDFEVANTAITNTLLGAATDAERDALINWHRGLDLDDEDVDAVTSAEMRPSAHGDVLHSRPVAINYGPDSAPDVVVFYGGNDGVLRAVNGNRAAAIGSFAAGDEMWSFVAPEFYGKIKRLRDNTIPISFTGSPAPPPDREPKVYGFDGPMAAYQDASAKWIFPSMRRGGRFLYAFDVTAMSTSPGSATLKWKLGCPNQTDDTDCSSGLEEIGQTWSAPQIIKTSGYTDISGTLPMLMMGGGHDTCEDADPHTCTSSAKGRAVYVLDANDGTLLKSFTTDRPVVADVFIVPDSTTGLAKFAYAADMGGNLYRISGSTANVPFDATLPASWTMTKIASLGCDGASETSPSLACPMNRKFLSAPDVVEKDGVYHLLIGSGDREKPLQAFAVAYEVDNKFFMVKDNPADPDWLADETSNCGSAVICLDSLVAIENNGADPDPADLAAMKGWSLDLRDHEQAVTSAITVFGTTTFSTHTPTLGIAGSCASNLGLARVYNLRFSNAAAANGATNRDTPVAGGGLPSPPVAGMVQLDDGTVVPFIIGAVGDSPLEGSIPPAPSTGSQPKSLTYWFIDQ